jgi:hypothetical protein
MARFGQPLASKSGQQQVNKVNTAGTAPTTTLGGQVVT